MVLKQMPIERTHFAVLELKRTITNVNTEHDAPRYFAELELRMVKPETIIV